MNQLNLRRMGDQFGAKVRNEIERIQRMEGPSRCAHWPLR